MGGNGEREKERDVAGDGEGKGGGGRDMSDDYPCTWRYNANMLIYDCI